MQRLEDLVQLLVVLVEPLVIVRSNSSSRS